MSPVAHPSTQASAARAGPSFAARYTLAFRPPWPRIRIPFPQGEIAQTYLVASDDNGNVMALVRESDQKVMASYDYAPFGAPVLVDLDPSLLPAGALSGPWVLDSGHWNANPCPFLFSTKYYDAELPGATAGGGGSSGSAGGGLYYYGYRFYDPALGRWLSRDPIAEDGGLNLYAFCQNDPVNAVDVLGEDSVSGATFTEVSPTVLNSPDGSKPQVMIHNDEAYPYRVASTFDEYSEWVQSARSAGGIVPATVIQGVQERFRDPSFRCLVPALQPDAALTALYRSAHSMPLHNLRAALDTQSFGNIMAALQMCPEGFREQTAQVAARVGSGQNLLGAMWDEKIVHVVAASVVLKHGAGPAMKAAKAVGRQLKQLDKLADVLTFGFGRGARKAANRLATQADEAVFWSGIADGKNTAAKWASRNGGATLESTTAARGVKLPEWDKTNPATVAAWRQASKEFAEGASGKVRVLQDDAVRLSSVWAEVEFPALKANPNVQSIVGVNPDTGAEVLLWSR